MRTHICANRVAFSRSLCNRDLWYDSENFVGWYGDLFRLDSVHCELGGDCSFWKVTFEFGRQ